MNGPTELDTCGCCGTDAAHAVDQVAPRNRPGQPAISYRIGTQPTFLRRMLARLPSRVIPAGPTLGSLTTRAENDPSIALLDAWATVADVLTFYQERIANEGYLRTATERLSVLEMARAIGYELNPGVAASTYLAFTVESAVDPNARSNVGVGVKVLSIPGQDERPQTFETIESLEARAVWNRLRPRQTELRLPVFGGTEIYLKGVTTGLRPGDPLLLVGDERRDDPAAEVWDFRRASSVTADPEAGMTKVTWTEGLGWTRWGRRIEPARANPKVFTFRQRAALFGYNAPDWRAMPDSIKASYLGREPTPTDTEWPGFSLTDADTVDLDAVYPQIVPGGWLVLSIPNYEEVYEVEAVEQASRTDFTLTARTTRVTLDGEQLLELFGNRLRDTVVFAQSEELGMAEQPITDPVQGSEIVLDRLVPDLVEGKALIVSGRPASQTAESAARVSEVAFIAAVADDGEHTILTLAAPLGQSYDRASVEIMANVARATHGETTNEVLGSGDGSAANQRFVLKKPPLTYVSAPTASGAESALAVRVDGVEWQEAPSLFGLGPRDQSYSVRISNEGTAAVVFGDGTMGARLPTGQENVQAVYRSGLGPEGAVRAGSLTLLQVRPLGIRDVTNPLPATGAAAPEPLAEARTNAPLTVLTLDRIVSLRDFEDFARAFAGIGKAQAVALWNGERRLVHLTVADATGQPLLPGSALDQNLRLAIDAVRDPSQEVRVDSFQLIAFRLAAHVLVDQRYVAAEVLADVRAAMVAAFSFEERHFGQPVTAAEVIAEMQGVTGVVALDLNQLYLATDPAGPGQTRPPAFLPSAMAAVEDGQVVLADLLVVDPAGIALEEMRAS